MNTCTFCTLSMPSSNENESSKNGENYPPNVRHSPDLEVSSESKRMRIEKNGDAPPIPSIAAEIIESKEVICPCCLNITKPEFLEDLFNSLSEQYDAANYIGIKNYALMLYLPPSIFFRQGLFLKRSSQMKVEDGVNMLTTKLRNHFLAVMDAKFGAPRDLTFNSHSKFAIQIDLRNKEAMENDACFLQTNIKKHFVRARKLRRKRQNGNTDCDLKEVKVSDQSEDLFHRNVAINCAANILPDVTEKYLHEAAAVSTKTDYKIDFDRENIIIGGRYNKFSREIFHAYMIRPAGEEDPSDGKSVEKFICKPLMEKFRASGYRFTSTGREDINVRMLGEGRPFGVLVMNPRNPLSAVNLAEIEAQINEEASDLMSVNSLESLSVRQFDFMKSTAEQERKKTYVALCTSSSPIPEEKLEELCSNAPYTVLQKTPARVLSSRSLSTRKRTIEELKFDLAQDGKSVSLTITAQSGTYIKELIHGDFGRTKPSIAELLKISDLDIIQLDVIKVDFPWPITNEIIASRELERNEAKQESEDEA